MRVVDDGDQPIDLAPPSRLEMGQEALTILLDSGQLSRLVLLLVALGYTVQARELLALQASILAALTQKRRNINTPSQSRS